MEPAIKTGSIVFSTLQSEEINRGDIIVFQSPEDSKISVIHRVRDIEDDKYTTKGDNNEKKDDWTVFKSNILGKVFFTIPYVGYLIDWMKTPLGFGVMFGIPALFLIISQIKKIKEGINDEVDRKTKIEVEKQLRPPIVMMILLLSSFLFLSNTPISYALFSARAEISGMTVSVGEIKPTIPKVIINEVMWSGTSVSEDDQWIELFNTTGEDINIGKWKIEYLRGDNKPPIMIPANKIIPANGYFVISNYSNESNNSMLHIEVDMSNASMTLLPTSNGNLTLKDIEGNKIDEVLGETVWPAGLQSPTYNSMQRVTDGIDGLNEDNWYTCENDLCKSSEYWKIDNTLNFGSPGNINILNN